MTAWNEPFHAHVYYEVPQRAQAERLQSQLKQMLESPETPSLCYVGKLRDFKVGPHPIPQFEIHFNRSDVEKIVALITKSGLVALVHPLTQNDIADHTTLAQWIGKPLDLDLSVLDPPGVNQGIARFSKKDF